jgi:hypothetical protein
MQMRLMLQSVSLKNNKNRQTAELGCDRDERACLRCGIDFATLRREETWVCEV